MGNDLPRALSRHIIKTPKALHSYLHLKSFLTVTCVLSLLTGCEDVRAIWIKSGSTMSHLVFYIGRERGRREAIGFDYLAVEHCSKDNSGSVMWGMEGIGGTQYADSVVYGVLNQRFKTTYPKRDLMPGCYTASISGTGRVTFDVRSDGSVAERASDEH